MDEFRRQLFHVNSGLAILLFFFIFGFFATQMLLFATLVAGFALIHLKLQRAKLPIIDNFLEKFERPGAIEGAGALYFATGALLAVSLLSNAGQVAAVLLILALGDGFATIIGSKGRHKLPFNGKKTAEGSIAMMLFSMPAYFTAGWIGIIAAAAATIAEALPISLDDNLSVPLACILVFKLAELFLH
jgi:dolichol kinase